MTELCLDQFIQWIPWVVANQTLYHTSRVKLKDAPHRSAWTLMELAVSNPEIFWKTVVGAVTKAEKERAEEAKREKAEAVRALHERRDADIDIFGIFAELDSAEQARESRILQPPDRDQGREDGTAGAEDAA